MSRVPLLASAIALLAAAVAQPAICRAQTTKADAKQICILMHETSYSDVEYAGSLAAHGNVIAGCLISEVSAHAPGSMRAEAAAALVQTMAKANPPLDPQTAQRARETVLKALHDKSVEVRVATITAMTDFGDESMVPELISVAKSDPVLSLRDYTALAITRMRKRLDPSTSF